MLRRRWPLILVLALMPWAGCNDGGECDRCDSDDDCKNDLICVTFRDEQGNPLAEKRCGSGLGATQCRTVR